VQRENGIHIGVVEDLDDPERLGRVRVRLPHLADQMTDWSRQATPMGGKDRGLFFRPEVGDEVLLACEHGDPRRTVVVGSLWSKADPPPSDDGNTTDNNWRFFRSRAGHVLKFDDTSGAERIEIVGAGEDHKLVIDVSGKKIQITCSSGDVSISAPSGQIALDADRIEIKAKSSMTIDGGQSLTAKATSVAINP
jgi:phage baseplate assembly protein V